MSPNEKSFKKMLDILPNLARFSEKHWRNEWTVGSEKANKKAITYKTQLINIKIQITESELKGKCKESLGKSNIDFENKFLYLPPLEADSHFVPILSLSCKLDGPEAIMRICVEMHGVDLENGKPVGLGFRFESSHKGEDGKISNHNYWHVQLVTEDKARREQLPNCPKWIPTHIPAIHSRCIDPLSFLFFVLFSFYGRGILNYIAGLNIDKEFTDPLTRY